MIGVVNIVMIYSSLIICKFNDATKARQQNQNNVYVSISS